MEELFVVAINFEDAALKVRDKLGALQKQELITLSDAAAIIRERDSKPKVKQAQSLINTGALPILCSKTLYRIARLFAIADEKLCVRKLGP